ncbi:hypothetical protein F4810DRAFT_725380 [Camillea tinctor]|nr:hypothetical protein F4810DRAFT_725380 [Camillea tinctor]
MSSQASFVRHHGRSPSFQFKLKTIERLEASGLEYTLLHNGIFLDYLVWLRVPSHLYIESLWFQLRDDLAVIPGDGNDTLIFTNSSDVAKFVAAWEEGKCTMLPRNPNELDDSEFEARAGLGPMWYRASLGLLIMDGVADLDPDQSLNKVFPDIKAMSVRDAVTQWKLVGPK